LNKVHTLARKQDFCLLMTQVAPQISSQLEQGGLSSGSADVFKTVPDLDHALEWCEDRLLATGVRKSNGHLVQLEEQLKDAWPKGVDPNWLMPYLERLEVPSGAHLIRQSELSESLYFVESGRVTARLEFEDGRTLRLRTMGAGTVVGEVGLFLRGTRAASVVTDQSCVVYRLSAASLEQMSHEKPDLALAFHRYVICLLGERLTSSTALLRGIIE
jgi:SulP family sulfate permease